MGVVAVADESPVSTLVSGTTLNGYVTPRPSTSRAFNRRPTASSTPLRTPGMDSTSTWWTSPSRRRWTKASGARATSRPLFGPQASEFRDRWAETTLASGRPCGAGARWATGSTSSASPHGVTGYESADSPYNPNFSRSPIPSGADQLHRHHDDLPGRGLIKVTGGIADSAYDGTKRQADLRRNLQRRQVHFQWRSWKWHADLCGRHHPDGSREHGRDLRATLTGGIVDNGISNGKNAMRSTTSEPRSRPIKEVTVGAAWDYNNNGGGNGTWATAIAGYVLGFPRR